MAHLRFALFLLLSLCALGSAAPYWDMRRFAELERVCKAVDGQIPVPSVSAAHLRAPR